ncbi:MULTISPECIES: GTPase [unclassified Priestia]|uniref:GTPase n=1 Tax=unclassified Priestia TaxID=2800374 RepID=UPI0036703585
MIELLDIRVNKLEDNNIYEAIDAIKEELEKLNIIQVKIALFRRPGAGKSSLINGLVWEDVAKVSQETNTKTPLFFRYHLLTPYCIKFNKIFRKQ